MCPPRGLAWFPNHQTQWDNGAVIKFRLRGLCLLLGFSSTCLAMTRHYYIAAEDVTWNYAPSGINLLTAVPLPQQIRLNLQWPKTRFIE
jgi:hypothetical protein